MSEKQAHCQRCLLPVGVSNIRLDASGVCTICRTWDEQEAFYSDFEQHQPILGQRLEQSRGRFHYDASVGMSGGKDSAYVLHRMTSAYAANVLAITFDNGFLTEYAWRNIEAITTASGVDHLVYRPDWGAMSEFYRATLRKLGDPCVACSIGGYILSVRGCNDLRIPRFVHGRSPMQMFRDLHPKSKDPGLGVIRANLSDYDAATLRRYYQRLIRRIQLLLLYTVRSRTMRVRINRELFGAGLAGEAVVPEFLAFFLFEPYDEEAIKQHLESIDSGYQRPPNDAVLGHGDCLLHDVSAHLYQLKHGVNRVLPDVAAMLRQGAISADEVPDILAANTPSGEDIEISTKHLLERLDMKRDEYEAIAKRHTKKAGSTR
ncbi:hypothetical protein ACFLSG_01340 [Candidatus Bipolaricaulota bacterium]